MKLIQKKFVWEILGFIGLIFGFAFGYSLNNITILTWIWLSLMLFSASKTFWFERVFKVSFNELGV